MNKRFFSLREAAEQVGKDKMTISRAIHKGKLSATKEDNQWKIEPSELFRVFEPAKPDEEGTETGDNPTPRRNDTSPNGAETDLLRLKLDMKDKEIQRLENERERERAQLHERIDDLARRLDKADQDRTRLTAVLTDERQREEANGDASAQSKRSPESRGLFSWLRIN